MISNTHIILSRLSIRCLEALECTLFDVRRNALNETEVKQLILWLEETKIRLLPTSNREGLQHFNDKNWFAGLVKYLKNIGILTENQTLTFADWNGSAMVQSQILEHLIFFAVEDEYLDLFEQSRITTTESQNVIPDEKITQSLNINSYSSIVNNILRGLDLPLLPRTFTITTPMLLSALNAVVNYIKAYQFASSSNSPRFDFQLPLGFSMQNNKEIARFVVTLRLLHLNNLKTLQYEINMSLARLQEITGNPKTDSTLGRVGR